ncbi:hypothetical protein OIO90_006534 [Microbotryomycetes sp. JL221]|nr:hypothetical protein OIO90_006534 [Microbotryomycetes sp. JL221]
MTSVRQLREQYERRTSEQHDSLGLGPSPPRTGHRSSQGSLPSPTKPTTPWQRNVSSPSKDIQLESPVNLESAAAIRSARRASSSSESPPVDQNGSTVQAVAQTTSSRIDPVAVTPLQPPTATPTQNANVEPASVESLELEPPTTVEHTAAASSLSPPSLSVDEPPEEEIRTLNELVTEPQQVMIDEPASPMTSTSYTASPLLLDSTYAPAIGFKSENNNATSDRQTTSARPQPSPSGAAASTASASSSSKSILTMALQRAQSAVLLDSANNVPAAIAAYSQSVRLLQEVMARVEENARRDREKKAAAGLGDRSAPRAGETNEEFRKRLAKAEKRDKAKQDEARRLRVIHDTYKDRIRMLQSVLTPTPTASSSTDVDSSEPISAPLMTAASASSRQSRDGRSIASFGTVSTPPASFATAQESDAFGREQVSSIPRLHTEASQQSPALDRNPYATWDQRSSASAELSHPFAYASTTKQVPSSTRTTRESDIIAGVLPTTWSSNQQEQQSRSLAMSRGGSSSSMQRVASGEAINTSPRPYSPRTSSLQVFQQAQPKATDKLQSTQTAPTGARFSTPSFSPPPSLGPEPDSYLNARSLASTQASLVSESTALGTISQRRRTPSGRDYTDDAHHQPSWQSEISQADEFGHVHVKAGGAAYSSASLPSRMHASLQPSRRPGLPSFNSEYAAPVHAPMLKTASRSQSGPGPEGVRAVGPQDQPQAGGKPPTLMSLSRNKSTTSQIGQRERDSRPPPPPPPMQQMSALSLSREARTSAQSPMLDAKHGSLARPAGPVSSIRRPFHLLRQILETLEGDGAYVTPRLYVPRRIWSQTGVKLTAIETKVRMLDLLATGLESVRDAAVRWQQGRGDAATFSKELESFDGLMDGIQSTVSKKLGLSSSNKKGAASFSSWSSKLSRSLDRVTNGRSLDHPATYVEALLRALQHVDVLGKSLLDSGWLRTKRTVTRLCLTSGVKTFATDVKRAGSWFES